MKLVLAVTLFIALLAAPVHAQAVSRDRAQHYRYANAEWCPQNWRTTYGAKRLIVCEARLYGVNPRTATYVAWRESRFHWWAANGCCKSLFQQNARYWRSRFRAYAPHRFHYSIFGGRTNTVVSLRMAKAEGWGAWGQ